MTSPAVGTYTHRASTVHALQFDGTIEGLLAIFNLAADHRNLVITVRFDSEGTVGVVSYGLTSATLTFGPTDWLVFPQDSPMAYVMSDADFQVEWQSGV